MKLTEVDSSLTEGILDSAWAGTKAIGLSAIGANEKAKQVLAKKQFTDTFVKKMSTMLATQWPAIQKAQQEKIAAQEKAQAAQQQKAQAMATKTAPQAAQPSTIIDPKTGKPFVAETSSSSYNLFRRRFDKALTEATAQEANPNYGMAEHIMKVLVSYMNPIDLSQYTSQLENLANQIANTYQSNHGIPTMKDLGGFLYDIMQAYKQSQGMEAPKEEPKQRVTSILNTIKNLTDEEKQQLMAALQPQQKQ
jgi:hypothetical protein